MMILPKSPIVKVAVAMDASVKVTVATDTVAMDAVMQHNAKDEFTRYNGFQGSSC